MSEFWIGQLRELQKRERESVQHAGCGSVDVPPQHLDITGTMLKVACGGGLASDPILMDANGRVLTHDPEARERIAALEARVEALEKAVGNNVLMGELTK